MDARHGMGMGAGLAAAVAALALAGPLRETSLPLHACTVAGQAARCGTLLVPENRSDPGGRQIGLRVVVVPARRQPAARDAFTWLAGGPGGVATEAPGTIASIWSEVGERHDLLLVDQRGTGGSNELRCPETTEELQTDAEVRAYVDACLASVPGDPRFYGTAAAADDLDAVREALGYPQLDVYGVSYGATLAQVYLTRHPASVRALVLDGATFADVPFYGRFAASGQRALDLLDKRCRADRACARAFPRWRAQLTALMTRWNRKPVRLPGGLSLTGDGLAGVVQQLTISAATAATVPRVVARAAAGDLRPLAADVTPGGGASTQLMIWTILCNEPWVGLDSRGPWGTYLDGFTASVLDQNRSICSYLPAAAPDPADWVRPHGALPVLVLAGGADPQDPLGNLPGLTAAFPAARAVVAPGQGHAVGAIGCLPHLVARVVDRGSTAGLDTSCARSIAPAAFSLSP